ncbi:MAG: aspartate 1-decarboxylase [Eubacterium sp.]|nr:aspartate 1-decarboxylase [Eubacterium sp.]
MLINVLKSKIHRATVTQAELNYVGSITIDQELMDSAGLIEYEKVQVVDIDNGARLETYVIAGDAGSGVICLNGAAARCVATGDRVIIMNYAMMTPEEFAENPPRVIFVDCENHVIRSTRYEKHGTLEDMPEDEDGTDGIEE